MPFQAVPGRDHLGPWNVRPSARLFCINYLSPSRTGEGLRRSRHRASRYPYRGIRLRISCRLVLWFIHLARAPSGVLGFQHLLTRVFTIMRITAGQLEPLERGINADNCAPFRDPAHVWAGLNYKLVGGKSADVDRIVPRSLPDRCQIAAKIACVISRNCKIISIETRRADDPPRPVLTFSSASGNSTDRGNDKGWRMGC